MVLKELTFNSFYFGVVVVVLKELIYKFLHLEGVVVLKELVFKFLHLEGVVVMKELIFRFPIGWVWQS